MTDQIVLVRTSPRLPAGLLSADGWAALGRGPVYAKDPHGEELALAVRAAGIEVTRLDVPGVPGGPLLAPSPAVADARALRTIAAKSGGVVLWLLRQEGDAEFSSALADLAAREGGVSIEVVVASWDPPRARLLDAVAVMDRLRAPGGCPWDADETHASLAPYLIEEVSDRDLFLIRRGASLSLARVSLSTMARRCSSSRAVARPRAAAGCVRLASGVLSLRRPVGPTEPLRGVALLDWLHQVQVRLDELLAGEDAEEVEALYARLAPTRGSPRSTCAKT